MRALLVADLKADSNRLAWLDSQASRFDLIAIAGNFLDVFSPVPSLSSQIISAIRGIENERRLLLRKP
jgi:hypothetical protein